MSNKYQDWEDDDDNMEDDDPNSTDLVRKLRKADRSKEKRIRDLESELNTIRSAQRGNSIKSILSEKGVNPKAVRLILKDLDEVNEESVNNWLEDNGDLFGLTTQEAPQSNVDRAALRQQDAITQGAITPDRAENLEQRLGAAESAEEILSILRSQ